MKILVTGGTGFVARHFVPALLARGHEVALLDLWEPRPDDLVEGVTFFHGDVRDRDCVARALSGCDSVLHLAAAHHDFGITEETYFSVNEEGTRVLCEAMTSAGVRRICFFSSVAVYGDQTLPDESSPPSPVNTYGRSKLAAEGVLNGWVAADDQRSVLTIRPPVIFGPGNYANMFRLIRQIERRAFLPVGRGTNRKSMAFIDNIVEAALYAWDRHAKGANTYNCVDKPDLTSREIIDVIYRCLGRRRPPFYVPLELALAAAWPLDMFSRVTGRKLPVTRLGIQKLAGVESTFESRRIRDVGFEASVPLQEGISRMVDWYLTVPAGKEEARIPPAAVVVT